MKNSEKFWNLAGNAFIILWIFASIFFIYKQYEQSSDHLYAFTVEKKYSTGYHHKHSVGENFYLKANMKGESYTIPVTFSTYDDTKPGDTIYFKFDSIDIRRYYNNSNQGFLSQQFEILMLFNSFIFICVFTFYWIGYFCVYKGIAKFNKFLDKDTNNG